MRRILLVLSLLAASLLALVRSAPGSAAQDATPASEEHEPAGVTLELLAVSFGVALPSTADLYLVRFLVELGASLPSEADDPSLGMMLVEAGELTARMDTAFVITRAGAFAAAAATAAADGPFAFEEAAPAGETVRLQVGDVAYFPPNIGGEVRNDGDTRAVVLGP